MRPLLQILLLLIATTLYGQDASTILQRYFDTVSGGNIENWKKIKSVFIESESFYSQQNFESQASFSPVRFHYLKTYREWPDKLKIEIYEDSTYSKFLSSTLWLPNKNKLILRFSNMQPIIKELKDNPWDFKPVYLYERVKNSKSIIYKGIKNFELDSISCFDIEIKSKDNKTINLYLNTQTYLLEYWKILIESSTSNYVKFYDYKIVEGLSFHFVTQAMKDGQVFDFNRIKRVHINYAINPEIFRDPEID